MASDFSRTMEAKGQHDTILKILRENNLQPTIVYLVMNQSGNRKKN